MGPLVGLLVTLACGRAEVEPESRCFDGGRALSHVEAVVAFGPRHAGSEGIGKTRRYIVEALRELGLEPREQRFEAETSDPSFASVPMVNLLADVPGESDRLIVLGGHYDGKWLPDRELVGANDGGSSVGLLLEMARCLVERPRRAGVRIVFTDGEESVGEGAPEAGLYGSRNLAASLRDTGESERVTAAVIVDMIGDQRLRISRELRSTEWLWRLIEGQASDLGLERHFAEPPLSVVDDHVPLLQAGIPSVLLIDPHYGPGWDSNAYWHSEEDTLDKLSADSLEVVGRVLLSSLDAIAARPAD